MAPRDDAGNILWQRCQRTLLQQKRHCHLPRVEITFTFIVGGTDDTNHEFLAPNLR